MHRYFRVNSRLKKSLIILKENGMGSFLKISFSYLKYKFQYFISPLIIFFLDKNKRFSFQGQDYTYFNHKWNLTWTNERALELPIIFDFLKKFESSNILEIGAVLCHYRSCDWTVVDKFEQGNGIHNSDIEYFSSSAKYDLIVSISTLEHVGFDDEIKDSDKINRVFTHIKDNLLKDNGLFVFTIPLGYNKDLDAKIFSKKIEISNFTLYKKNKKINNWIKVPQEDVINCTYGSRYNGAGEVLIGLLYK